MPPPKLPPFLERIPSSVADESYEGIAEDQTEPSSMPFLPAPLSQSQRNFGLLLRF